MQQDPIRVTLETSSFLDIMLVCMCMLEVVGTIDALNDFDACCRLMICMPLNYPKRTGKETNHRFDAITHTRIAKECQYYYELRNYLYKAVDTKKKVYYEYVVRNSNRKLKKKRSVYNYDPNDFNRYFINTGNPANLAFH